MAKVYGLVVAVLLVVLFVAVNIVGERVLRDARLDLTEAKLYTLSDAAREVARSPDEPVRLTLYASEGLARGKAQLETGVRRVRESLESFAAASGGKVVLEVVDPEPLTEAEDAAIEAGMRGLPLGRDETFYLGLLGTNAVDGRETIPFFNFTDAQFDRFLEYEVAKLVHALASREKPVVGVISSLPLLGGGFDPATRQPTAAYQIVQELGASFEVRDVAAEAEGGAIPADVKVLLVVHPKAMSDLSRYAVDQYVLAGGAAVVFVDPVCEADRQSDPSNPMMAQFATPGASDLPDLFAAWGLSLTRGVVAGDSKLAVQVGIRGARGGTEAVPYVAYMLLGDEQTADADPATGRLTRVTMATAGILERAEGAGTAFEPLLTTSDEAAAVEAMKVSLMPDPRAILNDFIVPEGQEPLVLAARVRGKAKTAFASGKPAGAEDGSEEAGAEAAGEAAAAGGRAEGEINVVVVADCDMLQDRFWVQEQQFGGISLGWQVLADNGSLVLNLVEQMSGGSALASLRARGEYRRPLTRIEAMEKAADAELVAEEERLQASIREAETRINEILAGGGAEDAERLIRSPEVQAEVDRLQAEVVASRKQLREVGSGLRKDIEALQTRAKIVNTALVPALLLVMAVGLSAYRGARRRAERRKGRG